MIKLKLFNRTELHHRLSISLPKAEREWARRAMTRVAINTGVKILGWRPETADQDMVDGRAALSVAFNTDSAKASVFQQRVLRDLAQVTGLRVQLETSSATGGPISAAVLQERAASYRNPAGRHTPDRQGPYMSHVLPHGMSNA